MEKVSNYVKMSGEKTGENSRWQFSPGTGGSFQTEWVATFNGLGGRFGPEYAHKPEVQDRFINYYYASLLEINEINSSDFDIPAPAYVIFGHTHDPILWETTEPKPPKTTPIQAIGMKPVTLYNTGGWLRRLNDVGKEEHRGAAVFIYETDKGIKSEEIK